MSINWISVKDRPPLLNEEVLLLFQWDADEVHHGYLQEDGGYYSRTGRCGLESEYVTHWAKINLPEEEK